MRARPALLAAAAAASAAAASKSRKKGHDAFWIMDPTDQTCLTSYGALGPCDGDAMWVYVPRAGKDRWSLASVLAPVTKRMCLQRHGDAVWQCRGGRQQHCRRGLRSRGRRQGDNGWRPGRRHYL